MLAEDASLVIFEQRTNSGTSLVSPTGNGYAQPPSSPSASASSLGNVQTSASSTQQQHTATSLFIATLFKKLKFLKASAHLTQLLAGLVWLVGKAIYVYTLVQLYIMLTLDTETTYYMLPMLFLILVGACFSAIIFDWVLYTLSTLLLCSDQQQQSIQQLKSTASLHKVIQAQIASVPRLAKLLPSSLLTDTMTSQKDFEDKPAAAVSIFTSVTLLSRLVMHSLWLTVPMIFWFNSLAILAPLRYV